MVLKGDYPYLEATANLSESTRKVITAYDTVSETDGPKSRNRAATVSFESLPADTVTTISCTRCNVTLLFISASDIFFVLFSFRQTNNYFPKAVLLLILTDGQCSKAAP